MEARRSPSGSIEQVANCSVSLLRAGIGDPLLFLHGASGAGPWLPFKEELSNHFELLVPEHPGFGRSETPPWLDNVADLAYFYLDFIEHLGLKKIHLMGVSLGGWIAAELAVRNQTSLSTLTLIAPAGLHVPGAPNGDIFMWPPPQIVRSLYHNQDYAEAILRVQLSEEEQEIQLKNRLTTAKLAWEPRLHNPNLSKWLHRITVPTLILWGAHDKIIPVQHAAAFRDLIPGSHSEIFPESGHLLHIEETNRFVDVATRFLKGARA
jgi:pimeloyl-ACP methyl ester carboxylesterase